MKKMLIKSDQILKKFEEIHNYIYANDGLSPQQSLEEFIKILFIKIFTENNQNNQFFITKSEWHNIEKGDIDISFIERINHLFIQTKLTYSDLFPAGDRLNISPISLGFIVDKLQNISLTNSTDDSKGLAFQKFLSHQEKNGRGQFFTPPPVIDLCVEIMQPQPHETIIDPACGSGGFLISALKYLTNKFPDIPKSQIIQENLFGIDINKSIARLATMKLLLEANTKNQIYCDNSLTNFTSIKTNLDQPTGFDIVLANPPFGATGKITNSQILEQFDLGHKWKKLEEKFIISEKILTGQSPEILFIECCLNLLKPGGRMAIVLPNGNLENPSAEYLRFYIQQKAQILAVINLPPETFIPYGTGVKTSLLFLQKLPEKLSLKNFNNINKYSIFFGQVKKLGYQGNKNASLIYQKNSLGEVLINSDGDKILDEDFTTVINNYYQFQKYQKYHTKKSFVTNHAFALPVNQLKGRLDYDFYAPANRLLSSLVKSADQVYLGDVVEIVKNKSAKLKQPDQSIEYVELSDINTHSFEIINTTNYLVNQLPSRASYELAEGDIITAVAGNSVGTRKHATAMVTAEFAGCICTNGLRVLRQPTIDPYFLLYFLKSEIFLQQMFRYRTGAAIPSVSEQDLMQIIIYLPESQVIHNISRKVQKALQLRQTAQKELASIKTLFLA
jgi:type I restriction enzyme M protein